MDHLSRDCGNAVYKLLDPSSLLVHRHRCRLHLFCRSKLVPMTISFAEHTSHDTLWTMFMDKRYK